MKRTLSMALILGLFATASMAAVESVNTVGYKTVTMGGAGKLTLVGSVLDEVGGGDVKLSTYIDPDQLAPGTLPTNCDIVYVWDPSVQSYASYGVRSTDGLYHNASSLGAWLGAAVDPTLVPGSGLFLRSYATEADKPVSIAGQVPVAATIDVDVLGETTGELTMVSYPYPAPIDLQDLSLKSQLTAGTLPTNCDTLLFWDTVTQSYLSFGVRSTDNQFHDASSLGAWLGAAVTGVNVDVAAGFWVRNYGSGADFTWSESKPY